MSPASFSAKVTVDAGVHVLAVAGELDAATAEELKRAFDAECGDASAVLVDLESCDFVDSTGLAALVGASTEVEGRGGSFAICCAAPQVERLFEITGAASGLGLEQDRESGLASLAA
jgi:stage II sporulation protein AA (anti-sigma F factor antagonist)